MEISSIGPATVQAYPQVPDPTKVAGPGFAQRLAVAAATNSPSATAAIAVTGANTAATDPAADFTNMTPRQLYAQSQKLLKAGKIGLDDGFRMQMLAGGLDPNAPAYTSNTKVNYIDLYKSQLAGIVSRGGKGDAGYESYVAILNAVGPSERGNVG